MKLKLRAAAARDLAGIFDYSVNRHGRDRAEAYVREIQAVADRLLDHPGLGAETDFGSGLRTIGAREHRIFYRIEGNTVIVVRVLHQAMDVTRHL